MFGKKKWNGFKWVEAGDPSLGSTRSSTSTASTRLASESSTSLSSQTPSSQLPSSSASSVSSVGSSLGFKDRQRARGWNTFSSKAIDKNQWGAGAIPANNPWGKSTSSEASVASGNSKTPLITVSRKKWNGWKWVRDGDPSLGSTRSKPIAQGGVINKGWDSSSSSSSIPFNKERGWANLKFPIDEKPKTNPWGTGASAASTRSESTDVSATNERTALLGAKPKTTKFTNSFSTTENKHRHQCDKCKTGFFVYREFYAHMMSSTCARARK